MKLFVIGNGFDLRHKLPSRYSDFRIWLFSNYKISKKEIYDVPPYSTNFRNIESFSEHDFACYFLKLIDDACANIDGILEYRDWSSFEEALGYLDWTSILDGAELIYDKDGDLDPFNAGNNIEDTANKVYSSCYVLNRLFKKWIESIEVKVSSCLKDKIFDSLDNCDCLYLSFNYTSTLETIYDIKDVKHIHGYINYFDDLVIGHGNNDFNRSYFENNYLAANAEKPIENTFNYFKKKTLEIININQDFFSGLSGVNEIFIYGCSLNEIDKPYFIEIFKNIERDVMVHLYVYEDEEYKKKEEYILLIGKGKNVSIKDWKKEAGEK